MFSMNRARNTTVVTGSTDRYPPSYTGQTKHQFRSGFSSRYLVRKRMQCAAISDMSRVSDCRHKFDLIPVKARGLLSSREVRLSILEAVNHE